VKRLEDVKLAPNEREALAEIRRRLFEALSIEQIILFGSVARGEADEESDIDLLVVTTEPMTLNERHEKITDTITEVNLQYDTNFSTLVVDKRAWEEGVFRVMPIKQDILLDGVPV
jgi:predicted nucleotidyltransferase